MKKLLSLLFLICFIYSVNAQKQTLPAGEYYTEMNGTPFSLTISKNNDFQISMFKGKLIETDNLVKLELKTIDSPTFAIRYLEENKASDSLTITFNSNMKKYNLYYIFLGLQDNLDDQVEYISSETLLGETYYENDDAIVITVPKTNYLKLLENKEANNSNTVCTFKIPENVSKIEINYESSAAKDFNLRGEFNEEAQTITLYEGETKRNPLVFHIDYEKYISSFEKPFKTENNIQWRDEALIIEENYPSEYAAPYQFKLKTFENLDEALKKTSEENKVLVLFNTSKASKDFEKFITDYETWISNVMYDKYNEKYDSFNFFLLTDKDKKFVKKQDLKDESILAVNGAAEMLYKEDGSIEDLVSLFLNYGYDSNFISDIHLMKRLDNLVEAKKFNAKEAQYIFNELSFAINYLNSGYEAENSESSLPRAKDYLEKRGGTYYALKSGPEKVNEAFSKLVASHENDTKVDYQFANMIGNFLEYPYTNKLYRNTSSWGTEADLKAIDYLIKFKDPLNNYEAITDEDYDKNYYFKGLYSYTISDALRKAAENADADKLQKIKGRFQKLNDSDGYYFSFLKKYLPEEFLAEYESFYTENFETDENIVLQLNTLYDKQNSKQSWSSFKGSIGNQANEAAWLVVEEIDDLKIINQALRWSKMSMKISEDNPYFIDTYAQLVYKSGDKKEGIKFQEQAVNIVKNNIETYGETLLKQTEDALQRMKNNTY